MLKIAGQIFDQYDDVDNTYDFKLEYIPKHLRTEEFIKEAASEPPQAFALEILDHGRRYKKFPYDNPVDAYTSAWYLHKTARLLPKSAVVKIAKVLVSALEPYNVPESVPEIKWLKKVAQETQESVQPPVRVSINSTEPLYQSDEPQPVHEKPKAPVIKEYALVINMPDGTVIRKLPVYDKESTEKSIEVFNTHYSKLEPELRVEAALKLKEKAQQYGIQIEENSPVDIYSIKELNSEVFDQLYKRMRLVPPSQRSLYEELYEYLQTEQVEPLYVAKLIDQIDTELNLKGKVADPYTFVFKKEPKKVEPAPAVDVSDELRAFIGDNTEILNELKAE